MLPTGVNAQRPVECVAKDVPASRSTAMHVSKSIDVVTASQQLLMEKLKTFFFEEPIIRQQQATGARVKFGLY
jgi:hypothetical protein